jgi:hypothetical protein
MNVRFEGNNGHDADVTQCLLMTQSGHASAPSISVQYGEAVQIAAIQATRELMADYIREPLRACLVWQSGSMQRIHIPRVL